MAGDKRLSMLFPFRSEKKEAKFEVVNRKRSPLGSTTTPASPATPQKTSTRTPTPFNDVAKMVTAQSQVKRTEQAPKPPKVAAHNASPPPKTKPHNSIRLTDAPLANLNITGNLPPVPDYNSKSFAPPVTIQGRTVSLAKKDPPPRRKPPTVMASTAEATEGSDRSTLSPPQPPANSRSISSFSVNSAHSLSHDSTHETPPQTPHITVEDLGDIQEKRPIVFKSRSHESITPSVTHTSEPQTEEGFRTQLPGSFPTELSRPHTPEPTPQPLSKPPLFSPGYIERPVAPAFVDSQSSNRSSYISQGSNSEFFDANESIQKSTPNLALEQRSLFDDDGTPSEPGQSTVPDVDEDLFKSIPGSYSVESFSSSIANSEVSQQSSIAIQPLNFHRKTMSTASNTTVTPEVPSTHKKQLSLSDEIMRDIENYRPGGLHENFTSEDEDDFISPVTPLKMGVSGQLPLEMPQRSTSFSEPLDDENSGEDEDDDSITPTVLDDFDTTETPRLRLTNAGDEEFQDDLFQDSSDEALPKQLSDIPRLNPVDALRAPTALETHSLSRVTSVEPEIDFVQSPVYNYNGLPDIPTSNGHEDDRSFTETHGIPRSSSYHELNRQLTPELQQSPERYSALPAESQDRGLVPDSPSSSSYNQRFIPESPTTYSRDIAVDTPSTGDNASSFSYHQSPERRVFHVVNDDASLDKDNSSEVVSSRYNDDTQTERGSISQGPRTFHVVNDGDYSDSDSASFDATVNEDINQDYQDYSVVHQDQFLSIVPSSINETSSGDGLSFIARSPKDSEFSIGSPPKTTYTGVGLNYSDPDLNIGGPITPQQSTQNSSDQSSQMHSDYNTPFPSSTPVKQPVYDTRIEEKAAPVQNLGQFQGKSRRPPPGGALAVPTRVARSTSVSAPTSNYNSIQEDVTEPTPQHHVPETSKYVEMLRLGAGTTNTNVPATSWGLPIGIAEIDHSRFVSSAARAIYKRPTRLHKSDLKHGKIKQRQLALEVGDDEDDEVPSMSGTTEKRESMDLERFETTNSLAPSIGSPTMSMTSLSPRKDITADSSTPNSTLNRSGTLLTDKLPQVSLGVGRAGTVRNGSKAQMTLFIANPDMDSD